ncbi:MAG: YidH family protein [Nocardioidaceae bacterium]
MPEYSEPGQDGAGSVEPGSEEPQQLVFMQRMVDLSIQRTTLAEQRTRMAEHRTRLAEQRTDMAAHRSEMSAERSYMNAERTLSVWIRTALAVMVVGIAVDRFGLFLVRSHGEPGRDGSASDMVGVGLVALGVLIAVSPSVRFGRYARVYRRTHTLPHHHGPFMAPAFAVLVALFGVVLLVLLLVAP